MDSASAILWLALAVFNEARSEPIAGQIAVAETVLNRTVSECYPDTVRKVVLQTNQFSWVRRGGYLQKASAERIDQKSWEIAEQVALTTYLRFLLNNSRPLSKYTHFHTKDIRPAWASKGSSVRRIGKHIFMSLPC